MTCEVGGTPTSSVCSLVVLMGEGSSSELTGVLVLHPSPMRFAEIPRHGCTRQDPLREGDGEMSSFCVPEKALLVLAFGVLLSLPSKSRSLSLSPPKLCAVTMCPFSLFFWNCLTSVFPFFPFHLLFNAYAFACAPTLLRSTHTHIHTHVLLSPPKNSLCFAAAALTFIMCPSNPPHLIPSHEWCVKSTLSCLSQHLFSLVKRSMSLCMTVVLLLDALKCGVEKWDFCHSAVWWWSPKTRTIMK